MAIMEIRVRRFFTSDEADADITPSVTILQELKGGDVPHPNDAIARMLATIDGQLSKLPAADLRDMTLDEVREYRADEESGS